MFLPGKFNIFGESIRTILIEPGPHIIDVKKIWNYFLLYDFTFSIVYKEKKTSETI